MMSQGETYVEAQEGATSPAVPTTPASAAVSRTTPAASSSASAPAENASILDAIPRRLRYLLNDQGQPVPVLVDANLSAFLEWLERKQTAPRTGEPQVSVSSVEITGQVDEQFAHLDAVIRVEVSGSNQAILYPLGLGEAVILECQIEGPQSAVYEPKSADQGYRWWLEGEGSYEFRLKLMVPVRRVAPWRRLQLSVPLAPVSSLQLNVAEASPVLKAPEDVLLETRVLEGNQTQVRAAGFGTRLDLQWQPTSPAADQRTTLDVNTTLLVRGSSSGYLVEATQYVKALQGVFREFTVQLPDRCDLLQVEGA